MKILVAPDSFKDCLTASQVAFHIEKGILLELPEAQIRKLPLADGGEGTVAALINATGGKLFKCKVHDPLMRLIEAEYGISRDGITGIMEMAAASGLELLLQTERNPWITTSFGTGELIKTLLNHGCKRIIIGIGGSATNDAGTGMLAALGITFLDSSNIAVSGEGGELSKIEKIDISGIDQRIYKTEIIIASDVNNPLTGPNGASFVYGPQKGADQEMTEKLDRNLRHYAKIIKKQLGIDIDKIAGSGAAGGTGGSLIALLNATIQSGFEIISKETKLEEHIQWADLIITGEGRLDFQTQFGKTPAGIGLIAKKFNKPVACITGSLGESYEHIYEYGITSVFSISDKTFDIKESILRAPELLEKMAGSVIRMF
jgi:glycerate kinase